MGFLNGIYFKVFITTLLAAFVISEPPVSGYNYQPPKGGLHPPPNNYLPPRTGYMATSNSYLPPVGPGHNNHHGHSHDDESPKSYEFGYSVKDALSGNDYDRREASDGNVVRGEYRVLLPDGRMQIVTYHADWQTGFVADVRYEGEARYPDVTSNKNTQGYQYNAPSGFSGSLTGFHGSGHVYNPTPSYGPPGHH